MAATGWNGTSGTSPAGQAIYYPQHGFITEVKWPLGAQDHNSASYTTLPPLSPYGVTVADNAPIAAANLGDTGNDILCVLFAASNSTGPGLRAIDWSFSSHSWGAPYMVSLASNNAYGTVEWVSATTWTSSEWYLARAER